MKVSIIIAVLIGRGTIEQGIKSVLNQSYENLEYIIMDRGSTSDREAINGQKEMIILLILFTGN